MTDLFDRDSLLRVVRADLLALDDPAHLAASGLEELAYNAFEHTALLRRLGEVPAEIVEALDRPSVVDAALAFLSDLALNDRLDALIASATAADPQQADEDPLESPEHEDEVETLFLHRDRVQAALGEVARRAAASREGRARLARIVAGLDRFDERARAHIHEFFVAVPLVRALKARFDWHALDPATYWWWTEIEDAFDRTAAAPGDLETIHTRARSDACFDELDDVEWLRAAYAEGETSPELRKFKAHLPRCPTCRDAVRELEAYAPRPQIAPLRLAAAPATGAVLEELRARVYRPPTLIRGTPFSVAIGLREAFRLRFTFHEAYAGARTRALDGSRVMIEGLESALVEDGAAEIPLAAAPPLEDTVAAALAAPRRLRRPDGSELELP